MERRLHAVREDREEYDATGVNDLKQLEQEIVSNSKEDIINRWKFGQQLTALVDIVDVKSVNVLIEQVVKETGASRDEINKRIRLFKRYPTSEDVRAKAIELPSWHQMVKNGLYDKRPPQPKKEKLAPIVKESVSDSDEPKPEPSNLEELKASIRKDIEKERRERYGYDPITYKEALGLLTYHWQNNQAALIATNNNVLAILALIYNSEEVGVFDPNKGFLLSGELQLMLK